MSDATWLKVMSNGALGEARVRAILLERFHVLTRSIDAEGADFFIQLPASGRFTDELAPRLGIIQAKFAQDEATSHLVALDYAIDGNRTIDEFFVLVTVGREDRISNYLMSGADLARVSRTKRDGKEFYSISGRERGPFRQKSISGMLDKIESSLRSRTQKQNEQFYQNVTIPDFPFKRSSLSPEWLLPIPNESGFIPDLVYQIRIFMRAQLYSLDDVTTHIAKLLTTASADECAESTKAVIDDRAHEVIEGDEYLRFGPFRMIELARVLVESVKIHKRRAQKLRKAKQFDRFVLISQTIFNNHVEFFERNKTAKLVQVSKGTWRPSREHARTTVEMYPGTLDVSNVNTELVPEGNCDNMEGANKIICGRELWKDYLDNGPNGSLRELDRIRHIMLADLYRLMFPKERVGVPMLPIYMAQ